MAYTQSDRERQRYLTYEGKDPLPTFEKLFGVHGIAEAGLQRHGPGVIRTTATGIHMLKAAIALTPGCRSKRVSTSIRDSKALAEAQRTAHAAPHTVAEKKKPHTNEEVL